ncbi:MAG: SIS domain-containing protein [Microbacteriaceae bacterium]|nr:MAG: SIS domain-containing protein [Microbacteriaceae bacterium]
MTTKIDFESAVRSQPEQLRRVRDALREQLACAPLPRWASGDTVGVVAMGASHNSGHAFVAALAEQGRRAVNLTASDVVASVSGSAPAVTSVSAYQPADEYLVVSESGRSPEPIDAARFLTPGHRIGICNRADAPLCSVVDRTVTLDGVDDSAIYTVGYLGTLLAYGLIAEHAGALPHDPMLDTVPDRVAEALRQFTEVAAVTGRLLAAATTVDVIGRGVSYSSAAEFALVLREGLRMPTGCYETFEYTHGPVEAATPRSVVVMFGDDRERDLVEPLIAAGVPVVLVTTIAPAATRAIQSPLLTLVQLDTAVTGLTRAIVETVFAQLVLHSAAEHRAVRLGEFSYRGLGTKIPD